MGISAKQPLLANWTWRNSNISHQTHKKTQYVIVRESSGDVEEVEAVVVLACRNERVWSIDIEVNEV